MTHGQGWGRERAWGQAGSSLACGMASDVPARATADAISMAKAEADSSARSLPEPHPNQQHGLYSKRPIIRALLSDAEAEVWDAAPVPADCPEMLEEVFREYCVLKFRLHAWERGRAPSKDLAALSAVLRAYHIPLRGIIKAVEVHARMKEADQTGDMSDAVLAYLRTLPAHRLEQYMLEAEAPRFHPTTGERLTEVVPETPFEEVADDDSGAERDGPGERGAGPDEGTPDPGWPQL